MRKISNEEIMLVNKYWNAANYLSVAQLYLLDNPLLERPLDLKDIKHKLVGHWGTVPGQNFIWAHLNRLITKYDVDMIYISGPGHGGNSQIANTYLEGSYTEVYPNITMDKKGLKKLFKQFSFPGGVPSHDAPETPGSIHEGGELGYSLAHAFGAVLDNKDLVAACVVGDGEAETGPLATSWHLNKFLNPAKDGTVLPIFHINGYKIANPTVFGRMSDKELTMFFKGMGWYPIIVEENTIKKYHFSMANALEDALDIIDRIKSRSFKDEEGIPAWPVIILKTPKGWTGPKEVDGKKIEGTFRAHQIPMPVDEEHYDNLKKLEDWLKSYKPEEIWNNDGTLKKDLLKIIPKGNRRMGSNPVTNGGLLMKELRLPDFTTYKVDVPYPGSVFKEDTRELSKYIKDVILLNPNNFRIFGPDEALSNRLSHVFEATQRQWIDEIYDYDEYLNKSGRVIDSLLSEHFDEGALEGYILTGRHGFMNSYEAFIRIVDSMVSQHAKWLKICNQLEWRKEIPSLNYLLTSHVWQQDHNGFTHQDPGFLNHLVTKKADTVRMYLPPDTNCLLSCFDHCIRTKNYINVIIASKHPSRQWLNMAAAKEHCKKGIGVFEWASNDKGKPDLIMASCGDVPTLESIAATTILRKNFPNLKVRVVNVVDLMKLQSSKKHPHGLTDEEFTNLFPVGVPVIFAFHGYPSLIHQLIYDRPQDDDFHVHGYTEEGTITTAFDMRVQNHLDRFHLVMDALRYLKNLKGKDDVFSYCNLKLTEHDEYIREYGKDMDEIENWSFEEEMNKINR